MLSLAPNQTALQTCMTSSRLFNGPVGSSRAGALFSLMEEVADLPASYFVPPEFQDTSLAEVQLTPEELNICGNRLKTLAEQGMRRPDVPLTQRERCEFTDGLLKLLQLPWNGQITGAFLTFINLADEELPTAASGLFPTFESFRINEFFIEGVGAWPSFPRYNNFHLHFIPLGDGDEEIHRSRSAFRRFQHEEPSLEQSLTQQVLEFHSRKIPTYRYLPWIELELYQAYKIMASYVDEIAEIAPQRHPARALIS